MINKENQTGAESLETVHTHTHTHTHTQYILSKGWKLSTRRESYSLCNMEK